MITRNYPEHEKLQLIKDESQTCGEFINWLRDEKKIYLASHYKFENKDSVQLTTFNVPQLKLLLSEFFDIDYNKLMNEKDRMLKDIRGEK